MPGFFSVRPFPTDLIQYRDTEQRNLWQFKLATSTESSKLFQLHIWELHQIELTYYFQSFNCATLTLEMLAILNPEVLKSRGSIVSPIDVVKAATTHNMVQTTTVDAAKHWLFYAISDTISRDVKDQLDQISSPEQAKAAAEALKHPFALRYLTMRLEQSVKHNEFAAAQSKATLGYLSAKEEQTIDLSRYKHPAKTPQDGGIGFTITNDPNGSAVLLNFLPAGHFFKAITGNISPNQSYKSPK